nr:cytochrome c oxidase subunit II [Anaticola crassicornis]
MSVKVSGLMFQDISSPLMSYISSFHDHVMVVIIMVLSSVGYIMMMSVSKVCFNRLFFGNEVLELIWTSIPAMILGFLALPSLFTLYLTDEIMKPILTLKCVGHQWFWSYEYNDFSSVFFDSYMLPSEDLMDGMLRLLETDNNVIIPMGMEIRVLVTSMDVIHSWTVPSLGVKVDAVPGRLNQVCVISSRVGLLYGQCSEICGSLHSFMPICLEFVPEEQFLDWLTKW